MKEDGNKEANSENSTNMKRANEEKTIHYRRKMIESLLETVEESQNRVKFISPPPPHEKSTILSDLLFDKFDLEIFTGTKNMQKAIHNHVS